MNAGVPSSYSAAASSVSDRPSIWENTRVNAHLLTLGGNPAWSCKVNADESKLRERDTEAIDFGASVDLVRANGGDPTSDSGIARNHNGHIDAHSAHEADFV